MKTMSLLLALILPVFAAAECVTVEPLVDLPPSKKVRIVALVDGKPLQNARVEVLQNAPQPLVILRTNNHGAAKLPALKPGFYPVVATSANQLRYETVLHVLDKAKDNAGTFSLELQLAAHPNEDETPASSRSVQVSEHIQSLKGIVQDPSGAPVPGAMIRIFPKDFQGKATAIRLKADENGNFSSTLVQGTYTMVVSLQGFKSSVVGLEITPDGEAKELQITLKVGSC
jgi:hypothetical protein